MVVTIKDPLGGFVVAVVPVTTISLPIDNPWGTVVVAVIWVPENDHVGVPPIAELV